ncbi:S8 family serine peptidase [uncultured Lacinutrix sp.]|uniref:S8 family peptidase n=1 Tax=uncultured Lacinutrix sp. TaxID=574032 RepID=UPI0026123A1C|nr:S8 family serine peptidase [uncultured Lacinutrix sp.]
MRTIKSLMCIAGVFLLLFNSCSTEEDFESRNDIKQETENKKTVKKDVQGGLEEVTTPEYVNNQLIIRFREQLENETDYEYNRMKSEKMVIYEAVDAEPCSCEDDRIVLWTFPDDINIENRLGEMPLDDDLDGNLQFLFRSDTNQTNWYTPISGSISNKVATNNSGVTIAVIDSGVNYNYEGFSSGFLYKNTNECSNEDVISGRNFVESGTFPFDDNGHGTVVTSLITDQLDDANTNYQILPIKIFDHNGNTSSFKVTCALSYATRNNDVDIIVSSFGWYHEDRSFVLDLMQEVENDKLLIASAGNANVDSDYDSGVHFPSGYALNNILSIAATNSSTFNTTLTNTSLELAWYSNYGINSVDIAAPGLNIPFVFNSNTYNVSGTSFANAYAAGRTALLFNSTTPLNLKNAIISDANVYTSLKNKVKYWSALD